MVGHFVESPDEGVRKVSHCLAQELPPKYEVLTLNISNPGSWAKIITFHPDIIHYILSPTTAGLIASKLFSLLGPKAKTIISAIHPDNLPQAKWLSLLRPGLILVQSLESEEMFRSLGYETCFLTNGVDTKKFVPVSDGQKRALRRKYGILEDKIVILHVASLKGQRNLEVLEKLQLLGSQYQVIIVGRPSERRDERLATGLKEAGCLVWTQYFSKIEEIYALADCYVFPTPPGNKRVCIETPLSVLEAMSCNLPVITTKFGALPRIFEAGDGFIFTEKEKDFFSGIKKIRNGDLEVKTREKVLPYSWENIGQKLEQIYERLKRQG